MLSRNVGGAPPGAVCPECPRESEGVLGGVVLQPSSPRLVLLHLSLSNSRKSCPLGRPPYRHKSVQRPPVDDADWQQL